MKAAAKTVLITGSEGFTGRYMAAEMRAAGYRVVGLGSHGVPRADYLRADLMDPEALLAAIDISEADYIIHLAAIAFVGHGDADAFYRTNLIGTRHLLQALSCAAKQPQGILLASSANVYGNASAGVLDEGTPAAPANDYAVSKLAMEHMARLWMGRLPIVLVRPFNYTGIGQADNFLLPKIVTHFKQRAECIELGNLDVWRDFSDVRVVVAAYRLLLEANAYGETVNVCSGRTYSLREVIALCEQIVGHKPQVRVNPAFVREGEVKTLCGDAGRLRQLIGDWDTPPLVDTLRWMLEAK